MDNFILSIDQGTSGTKTLVFDSKGSVITKASIPLKTVYSENGFVEQSPEDIYQNVITSVKECISTFEQKGFDAHSLASVGISNQRETFVVWNKSGEPLYNAVVWQCKRSVEICEQLKAQGLETLIQERTGLIIDPYFSGTKLIWLYQNVEKVKQAIDSREAYFGTVDTWLLNKLTNGEKYLTDHTNASRTLFFNLETLNWDAEILDVLGLSNLNLPEIKSSSASYGETTFEGILDKPLKISAMIGDSHAAAFGEGCYTSGTAKATLGTGCSVLMNIGKLPKKSTNGMMTTICWSVDGRVDYALEGVIVSCGATIEWIKNELGLFTHSTDTEMMAQNVPDNNGDYLIPAFSGLGAPYWDMTRKAEIVGLNFSCNKNHIVRAALESVAYQLKDVVSAMEKDAATTLSGLMINGGMSANNFLMQIIADTLSCFIYKGNNPDISAWGAALLAGLQVGVYESIEHIQSLEKPLNSFNPVNDMAAYHQEWLEYIHN